MTLIDRVFDDLQARRVCVRYAGADHSATAAQSFGVDIGILLADPGLREGTNDAARNASGRRAAGRAGTRVSIRLGEGEMDQ